MLPEIVGLVCNEMIVNWKDYGAGKIWGLSLHPHLDPKRNILSYSSPSVDATHNHCRKLYSICWDQGESISIVQAANFALQAAPVAASAPCHCMAVTGGVSFSAGLSQVVTALRQGIGCSESEK